MTANETMTKNAEVVAFLLSVPKSREPCLHLPYVKVQAHRTTAILEEQVGQL